MSPVLIFVLAVSGQILAKRVLAKRQLALELFDSEDQASVFDSLLEKVDEDSFSSFDKSQPRPRGNSRPVGRSHANVRAVNRFRMAKPAPRPPPARSLPVAKPISKPPPARPLPVAKPIQTPPQIPIVKPNPAPTQPQTHANGLPIAQAKPIQNGPQVPIVKPNPVPIAKPNPKLTQPQPGLPIAQAKPLQNQPQGPIAKPVNGVPVGQPVGRPQQPLAGQQMQPGRPPYSQPNQPSNPMQNAGGYNGGHMLMAAAGGAGAMMVGQGLYDRLNQANHGWKRPTWNPPWKTNHEPVDPAQVNKPESKPKADKKDSFAKLKAADSVLILEAFPDAETAPKLFFRPQPSQRRRRRPSNSSSKLHALDASELEKLIGKREDLGKLDEQIRAKDFQALSKGLDYLYSKLQNQTHLRGIMIGATSPVIKAAGGDAVQVQEALEGFKWQKDDIQVWKRALLPDHQVVFELEYVNKYFAYDGIMSMDSQTNGTQARIANVNTGSVVFNETYSSVIESWRKNQSTFNLTEELQKVLEALRLPQPKEEASEDTKPLVRLAGNWVASGLFCEAAGFANVGFCAKPSKPCNELKELCSKKQSGAAFQILGSDDVQSSCEEHKAKCGFLSPTNALVAVDKQYNAMKDMDYAKEAESVVANVTALMNLKAALEQWFTPDAQLVFTKGPPELPISWTTGSALTILAMHDYNLTVKAQTEQSTSPTTTTATPKRVTDAQDKGTQQTASTTVMPENVEKSEGGETNTATEPPVETRRRRSYEESPAKGNGRRNIASLPLLPVLAFVLFHALIHAH